MRSLEQFMLIWDEEVKPAPLANFAFTPSEYPPVEQAPNTPITHKVPPRMFKGYLHYIANMLASQINLESLSKNVEKSFTRMSEAFDWKKARNLFETRAIEHQSGITLPIQ